MESSPKSTFVLSAIGLSAAEVQLLRSILRLSDNLEASWTVGDPQSSDALLIDRSAIGDGLTVPDGPLQIEVCKRNNSEPIASDNPILFQPIYAEELVRLLNVAARDRKARGQISAHSQSRSQELAMALLRWPPQRLLDLDRTYFQLAILLSRKPHSLEQLCHASRVSAGEIRRFLDLLASEGLLKNHFVEKRKNVQQVHVSLPKPEALGLIARIRSRLGLL